MIPIYRAKKIDSDEFVEGNLVNRNTIIKWSGALMHKDEDSYEVMKTYVEKIDPSTLAISFNGDKWRSILEVQGILKAFDMMGNKEPLKFKTNGEICFGETPRYVKCKGNK